MSTISASLAEKARRLSRLIKVTESIDSPVGHGGDEVLRASLEACLDARKLIATEQEKFRELIANAKSEVERRYREYAGEVSVKRIEIAAGVAKERLRLLDSLKSEADFPRELEKCRTGSDGTIYWFQNYAWGYDPRSPVKVAPFYPFPNQERYLRWLDETVHVRQTSGLVEKSRDEGATVGALNWCVKQWLLRPHFSMLLLSATEDLVDSKKDPSTLFEKIRFQLRLTPSWMLPKDFNLERDLPYMNIANPENGAVITGNAPTPNAGRQLRASFVLCDEFSAWPNGGYPQNISLSQTSPSILKLGTPLGMFNQYYDDRHRSGANVFIMDWRQHPLKDQRWYDALPHGFGGAPMSAQAIAQEVDRDYRASQPGTVWPLYVKNEPWIVITVSELRAFYAKHGINIPDSGDGRARVPLNWQTGRANDRGATAGHRTAWLWGARPRENHPLADSVFLFREYQAPIGASYREIADVVHSFEKPDGEGFRMVLSLNSHEAVSERDNYAREHGIYFQPWSTSYEKGIAQVTEFLTIIDADQPNPFRPELKGRTRLIIVVADGEGELIQNDNRMWSVAPAKSSGGLINLRRQIGAYHYGPEEAGKPVGQMRPQKIDDDFVDGLRAFAIHWAALTGSMTREERRQDQLPEHMRTENILKDVAAGVRDPSAAFHAREVYLAEQRGKTPRVITHGLISYRNRRRLA